MASIVLLIASGTIDTYTLHQSRLAVEQFQLDARSRESRRPRAQFDVSSGDNPDAVTRALAFIWSEFDPRHFLSVVSDPFVPPSFSLRAEEALSRDEPKTPPSARLMATQTALRKAGRICGCPENLSPAEKREASESLYWHPKQTAELDVFEAHHGAFCKELHLGLESGMLRSWVVLLFFGRGVARAARAAVPQASDRKELRATISKWSRKQM